MAEPIAAGTWVEIHRIVLPVGERAPQVPKDTRRVPLEMRLKGFLTAPAALGEEAEIVTRAGRRWRGTLMAVDPAYTHGFGPPVAELSRIGEEVRALLRVPSGMVPPLTDCVNKQEPDPSRGSQEQGPPQGERKSSFEDNNRTTRPEEPPASGGVSKGASRRKSTPSTEEGSGGV